MIILKNVSKTIANWTTLFFMPFKILINENKNKYARFYPKLVGQNNRFKFNKFNRSTNHNPTEYLFVLLLS